MVDLAFLSQADSVTLKLELAKAALETAKTNLETAKQAFDDVLAQADAQGIPKAKLKKLMEDRVQTLFDSGIMTSVDRSDVHKPQTEVKRATRRTAKKSESEITGEPAPSIQNESEEAFLTEAAAAQGSLEGNA